MNMKWTLLFPLVALAACDRDAPSKVDAPGEEASGTSTALDKGAALLQGQAPVGKLNTYLDGFHFYSGDPQSQVESHHYCSMLNEDVTQCVVFDGNTDAAKLTGVEYVISERLFTTLPAEEKNLWHSHVHEVRSGQLIAPGLPDAAERELMQKLAGTYGKTWHTWHTDKQHELPTGVPALMMSFTQDDQAAEATVTERDRRFEVNAAEKREERAALTYPEVDPDADAWQKGTVLQLEARPAAQGTGQGQGAAAGRSEKAAQGTRR